MMLLRGSFYLTVFIFSFFGHVYSQDRILSLQNKTIVEKAKSFLAKGITYEAEGLASSQCGGTKYRYRLKAGEDKPILNIKLFFKFDDRNSLFEKQELFEKAKACRPVYQRFFLRYGIDLDLEYSSVLGGPFQKEQSDWEILLENSSDRGHAYRWTNYILSSCAISLHEIGHFLGLPDEYYEAGTCRVRAARARQSNPYSLMENVKARLDQLAFYPRHFLMIFEQAISAQLRIKIIGADSEYSLSTLRQRLKNNGCSLGSIEEAKAILENYRLLVFKKLKGTEYIFGGERQVVFQSVQSDGLQIKCNKDSGLQSFYALNWSPLIESGVSFQFTPFVLSDYISYSPLFL